MVPYILHVTIENSNFIRMTSVGLEICSESLNKFPSPHLSFLSKVVHCKACIYSCKIFHLYFHCLFPITGTSNMYLAMVKTFPTESAWYNRNMRLTLKTLMNQRRYRCTVNFFPFKVLIYLQMRQPSKWVFSSFVTRGFFQIVLLPLSQGGSILNFCFSWEAYSLLLYLPSAFIPSKLLMLKKYVVLRQVWVDFGMVQF